MVNSNNKSHAPSPRQFRALRAWLGVNLHEAAKRTKLSVSTLAAFEAGFRPPSNHVSERLVAFCDGFGEKTTFKAKFRVSPTGKKTLTLPE